MMVVILDFMNSIYLYLISCFMFCFFYKHLLLTFISLEFIMIYVIYNTFNLMILLESSMFLMIFLMTLIVCEGALSLTLIILMVRFYGNDYINSLMILKW